MAKLSKIIKIKQTDYSTLLTEGEVTINGTTYQYDPNAFYVIDNPGPPEYAITSGYATRAGEATSALTDSQGRQIDTTYATVDDIPSLVTTTTNGLMSSTDKTKLDDLEVDYSKQYLTFVALEDGTFTFTGSGINYSIDGGVTWISLAANTASPTVYVGNKIMWKGTITPTSSGIGAFSSTGQFEVEGNIMSLLYGDNFKGQTDLTGKDYAFNHLFYYCTNVVNAENLSLPATTLTQSCYNNMFYGCRSLITAPKLPAITLASSCYNAMFNGCTSLTKAPALPAITLASSCYNAMFNGCTSLTKAPALPATTLAIYCYSNMFQNCTNLIIAPELPAITLASNCYSIMFNGCTKLNYIKAMFTTTPSDIYTDSWVQNVASSGTFVKNSAATWGITGRSGIPSGWNVYTESEWEYAHKYELDAKQDTLVSGTNIKTINNLSLLGSGNITIEGGSGSGQTNVIETVKVNGTALTPDSNKAVDIDLSDYDKKPLIIKVRHDDQSVPSGTYNNIALALRDGREVLIQIDYEAVDHDIIHVPLVHDYTEEVQFRFECISDKTKYSVRITETDVIYIDSCAIQQRMLLKMTVNDDIPSFTDANDKSLTVAQVVELLSDVKEDITILYDNYYYIPTGNWSFDDEDNWMFYTADPEEGTSWGFNIYNNNNSLSYDKWSTRHTLQQTITFNGSITTQALSRKGTWVTFYQKPSDGIPKTDLATAVQTSLGKADTALQSFTESDPTVPSHVKSITTTDISNWNGKTSNVGTITGITMNGASKGTSGVVNLGTVLTEHQSIKTINNQALTGTGNVTINGVPSYSASDNGKILSVVNGALAWVTPTAIYSGTAAPNNASGNNGDLYLQTS